MSKMTVIQLLNKIANGEEIKAKLKFKLGDIIITYYGTNNYYKTPEYNIEYIDKGCTTHDFNLGMIIKHLNDEIEIIEEEKKIPEKSNIDFNTKLPVSGCSENEAFMMTCISHLGKTIDSLIDYLKSKGE